MTGEIFLFMHLFHPAPLLLLLPIRKYFPYLFIIIDFLSMHLTSTTNPFILIGGFYYLISFILCPKRDKVLQRDGDEVPVILTEPCPINLLVRFILNLFSKFLKRSHGTTARLIYLFTLTFFIIHCMELLFLKNIPSRPNGRAKCKILLHSSICILNPTH